MQTAGAFCVVRKGGRGAQIVRYAVTRQGFIILERVEPRKAGPAWAVPPWREAALPNLVWAEEGSLLCLSEAVG